MIRRQRQISEKPAYAFLALVSLYLCLFMFLPMNGSAQALLPDSITREWMRYRNVRDDSSRVVCLSKLAFLYHDYLEDDATADSLSEAAIRIAEMSLRPGLLLLAYNNFLESTEPENDLYYQKALSYGTKAFQYARITGNLNMRWKTCINLTAVYLVKFNFNKAMLSSNEALAIAHKLNNDTLVAESYMYIGKCHGYKNQKPEAFMNFLAMKDLAEKIGDPGMLRKCYGELSRFYYDNSMFDDAIDYKRKEGAFILNKKPVDSVAYMWIQVGLQMIDVQQKTILNEQNVKKLIDFAIRNRIDRLKEWEFGLYRKHLLESDDIEKLYNFFYNSYPEEFRKLYQTKPEMYYRIKAYFYEFENKPDSAIICFEKAEQILINSAIRNDIYLSNFYNRYGQFLRRHGWDKEAIGKFTRAYNLCVTLTYYRKFEYMLTASRNLEKLYKEHNDYRNAWYFSKETLRISDSINTILKKDQLQDEEIKLERSQRDIIAEKARQKIRQGRNQLYMMAGGTIFFFIVSLLVYRNFRNQKRSNILLDEAKKQSDLLLLNILPHETAEELKSTGKASARRFDEVTVMFTDFKDFTQASERMTAEELVTEINFYFSEFDNIISRHNIEKIKIIGDSYMCAGGLPVANKTHATDVVRAALELQEFIITHKSQRDKIGGTSFELRIGIHTGPVVAGIVGLKKFAYDIWGDTVNTASRMESAGEINKVNISGETFKMVKDQFICTYRGKVTAKHKGEIDMYFVDRPVA